MAMMITSTKLMIYMRILNPQGFGFIEFEDRRDADDAVYELNGKDLMGEWWVILPENTLGSESVFVEVYVQFYLCDNAHCDLLGPE